MSSRPTATSTIKHWNDAYLSLEHLPWDTDDLPIEIREIAGRLNRASRILDIGCGRGRHAIVLADNGFNVTGIDLSEVAIDQAIRGAANAKVDFVCANAIEFQADMPFELVVDYSVFHHIRIDDREKYSKRCIDNMAEGGQLLLVCYSYDDPVAQGRSTRVGAMGNLIAHPTLGEIYDLYMPELELVYQGATKLGTEVLHDAHHLVFRKNVHPKQFETTRRCTDRQKGESVT